MSNNSYDVVFDPFSRDGLKSVRNTAWNRENDDLFASWFNPGSQQSEEFAQQILLQRMQDYWSVGGKMQAMQDAGINANVAAAGIAGASTPSVSSPNSAVGAGAQGVASAAQAAGAVNEAVNAGVNAYEKLSLTGVEHDKRKAEIRDLLASATHNEWLAYAVSEMLPFQKRESQANTYLKLAQYANAKEEFFNIQKEFEVKSAEVKRIKAERDLAIKQGIKVDSDTAGVELDNWKKNRDKEWYEKYGYDRNDPIDNILIDGMISGNDDVVTAVGDSVKLSSYSERSGFNQAEIDDGFDKAFNEQLGNEAASADYAEFKYQVDVAKMAVKAFLDALSSGESNPASFVIQKIMAGSLKGVKDEYHGKVKGSKPVPHPHIR